MTDKQIIEYKHIKCTRDDCCHYCGSVFCGYVDDIENLEKAYKAKEQECEELKEARRNSRCAWKSLEGIFCPEVQTQLDQLKVDNKHLNDLLNQALKELEQSREAIEKIKEIATKMEYGNDFEYDFAWGEQIIKICDEVNDV